MFATPPIPWARVRATFGPTGAGLLGGAFLGLAALPTAAPLHRNVARTYAQFPSLPAPSVAWDVEIPAALQVVALLIGLGAPLLTGALAVWLARPRDLFEDVSVGLTTALAGTLSAFVSCVGWAVVLAFVVVPSIADLTLVCDSQQPAADLAGRYPDLADVEPEKRGGMFLGKIVSDQVEGSSRAATWGVLASFLTMGTLAFTGTLVASALRRRNERVSRAFVPYLEITVPIAVSLASGFALMVSAVHANGLAANPFDTGVIYVAGLATLSGVMIAAALRRWPWTLRVCLALTWFVWLVHARQGFLAWALVLATLVLTGFLLFRHARTPGLRTASAP